MAHIEILQARFAFDKPECKNFHNVVGFCQGTSTALAYKLNIKIEFFLFLLLYKKSSQRMQKKKYSDFSTINNDFCME